MIYIVSGKETLLVKRKIQSIIDYNKDANIVRYDGERKDFSISIMIDSCKNIDLFSPKTLVMVNNPYFLLKKGNDEDLKILSDYCLNPLFECDLLLYSYDKNFNKRLSIYKTISSNAEITELNQLSRQEYIHECYQILNQYNLKLDKKIIDYLINSCNNSISIFSQNIEVLALYPDSITLDIVEKLKISSNEEDVFKLINSLTNKDVSKSIMYSRKLLSLDNNINGLISLIANQLRFLYEVSLYHSYGDSINMIMKKTGSSSTFRIEKALESLNHLKDNEILSLLDKLSDLDYKFKSDNSIDESLRFELFIISLTK